MALVLVTTTVTVTPALAGHDVNAHDPVYVADSLFQSRLDINAFQAEWQHRPVWQEPVTGRGVRVGIIDTGIDPSHPDLVGKVVAWRDFIHGRAQPYDDDTHGTHVAGIVAATGHLETDPFSPYFPFGARGVAPGAELLVAKAMDAEGNGDGHHVAAAIRWLMDPNGDGDPSDGAHVINLSIGVERPPADERDTVAGPLTIPGFKQDPEDIRLIQKAVRDAVRQGAVVVVAAGNHGAGETDAITFPGTMEEVITVGAVDADGRLAKFSNRGAEGAAKPDLVAPGVVLSTFPYERDTIDGRQDGYLALGGTSMAAPMVAGTVALLLEADPTLRSLSATGDLSHRTETIRQVLIDNARAPTEPGARAGYGHGILDTQAALAAVPDEGGAIAWGRLAPVLLLIAITVALVLVRRRRRRQRQALARLRREVATNRARLEALQATRPGSVAAEVTVGTPAREGEVSVQDAARTATPSSTRSSGFPAATVTSTALPAAGASSGGPSTRPMPAARSEAHQAAWEAHLVQPVGSKAPARPTASTPPRPTEDSSPPPIPVVRARLRAKVRAPRP